MFKRGSSSLYPVRETSRRGTGLFKCGLVFPQEARVWDVPPPSLPHPEAQCDVVGTALRSVSQTVLQWFTFKKQQRRLTPSDTRSCCCSLTQPCTGFHHIKNAFTYNIIYTAYCFSDHVLMFLRIVPLYDFLSPQSLNLCLSR